MKLNKRRFRIALATANIPAIRLARELEISRDKISYFENGHSEPDPETAKRIAERLGVRLEDLFEKESPEVG